MSAFNPYSAKADFIRQNLTSKVDSDTFLKMLMCYLGIYMIYLPGSLYIYLLEHIYTRWTLLADFICALHT